jgi:hypothetical protein
MANTDEDTKKEYLKSIDAPHFFDKMLTKLLVHQPDDPVQFFVSFVKDTQAGKDTGIDGEYTPKLMEDTVYVRKHNVTGIVNEWLEDLLKERPSDPLSYHVKWLEEHKAKK